MASLLLASGGLDSTVIAGTLHPKIHLTVDYGQNHARREIEAASAIAEHYKAEHILLPAHWLAGLLPSSLTGRHGELSGADTVVPARNTILLSLGLGVAMARGCETVLIGVNASDRAVYPDCRPEFVTAFNDLALVASEGTVGVWAPLLYDDKKAIGRTARLHQVPVELTWSCYLDGEVPCGRCGACQQREEALGVHDH